MVVLDCLGIKYLHFLAHYFSHGKIYIALIQAATLCRHKDCFDFIISPFHRSWHQEALCFETLTFLI